MEVSPDILCENLRRNWPARILVVSEAEEMEGCYVLSDILELYHVDGWIFPLVQRQTRCPEANHSSYLVN